MSSRSICYELRQIRISHESYHAIKKSAAACMCTMTEWYDHILTVFIKSHQNMPIKQYFSSVKNGKPLSLWIKKEKLEIIKEMASKAQVSDARVIFTAIMLFLEKKPHLTLRM